jgi:hypothetical protein
VVSNSAVSPPGAPAEVYRAWVVDPLFVDDAETDLGWTPEQGEHTNGGWVRMDPWGTTWLAEPMEPADDHTPAPGVQCFVTGAGFEGGDAQYSDVDNGCVLLTSPPIDLSQAGLAIVSYWRWFGQAGWTGDDSFTALASNDGGATWTPMETLTLQENTWTQSTTEINTLLPLTGNMRFRFVVCDIGHESMVEGAVDDFVVGVAQGVSGVAPGASPPRTEVLPNRPNPFAEGTSLRFTLEREVAAELLVFDMTGRLVRRLEAGRLKAGEHAVLWDGRDEAGRPAGSGVYFYELRAGETRSGRKLIRLR